MVIASTATILLLQVLPFWSILPVFLILCHKSVCFAQICQSHGKFYFLEIWLFFPLFVFAIFSKQKIINVCLKVK